METFYEMKQSGSLFRCDPTINKSANMLALCHPPSASFCSVLAGQWSSRIFTHAELPTYEHQTENFFN